MARKSPLNKLQETVVGTVKGAITHPMGTAEKAVEQAKGTLSLGRMVAGHVTKGAAGVVASRLPGHQGRTPPAPRTGQEPLRAVTPEPAPAVRAESQEPAAKETPAPKPAAKKPAAKKPAAKSPTPTRPPVTDVATESVKKRAANQPVKRSAPAPTTSIDAAADTAHVDVTPADIAKKATPRKPAAKAPAKKVPTKKSAATTAASSPSGKLPPRKSPATKAPAPKAPAKKALSAAEVLEDSATELTTPVGPTGADVATSPDTTDTGLQQPGTPPLVDSATAKAVAKEAAVGARAADPDKR